MRPALYSWPNGPGRRVRIKRIRANDIWSRMQSCTWNPCGQCGIFTCILAARELESCVSLIVAVPLICIILWLDLLQRHDTLNCSSAVDGWQKGKISIYEGNKRKGARDPAEWEREKRFLFLIRAVTTFTSTRGWVVWVSFGCVWNPLWLKSTVAEMKGGEDAAEAKSEWKAWKWAAAQMKDELLAEWQ